MLPFLRFRRAADYAARWVGFYARFAAVPLPRFAAPRFALLTRVALTAADSVRSVD